MPRRVLLLLTQFPFDTLSGAAHPDRTTCTFLAARGFDVRALATTATERISSTTSWTPRHLGRLT